MKTLLARLESITAPALRELIPHVWVENWDRTFFSEIFCWHYLDRRCDGGTWLAFDNGQCIAMLDSYIRPYLLDGRRLLVRETADWFCLPKYRPFGLGLKLMRKMMEAPEPIIVIGGTDATLSILPRLGWQCLSEVRRMILPVTLRGLAGNVLRRWGARHARYARAVPGLVPVRSPRLAPTPASDTRVEEWHPGQKLTIPLPQRAGLIELLEPADLDWLYAAPRRFIQPMVLVFSVGSEPVGLSLSQLEPSASGPDGKMVHLQIANCAQPVTDWIVSETARRLAQRGAGVIRCRASIPQTISALQRTGFITAPSQPVHWWARGGEPPPTAIDVGYLCANDALPLAAAATLMPHTGSNASSE